MSLNDKFQRGMARFYLRYISVFFCVIASISLSFKRSGQLNEKRLLILKPDAIGDYILFRNFLTLIRKSARYNGYRITFCGNSAYREFAVCYDSDSVNEFVWIDKNRIYRDLFYYIRIARTIYKQYDVTIHASRSRELIFDFFAKISGQRERISPVGDTVNILNSYKRISDHWYTRLIPAGNACSFEFDAFRQFFEILLEQPILLSKPYLLKDHYDTLELPDLPQNFVALFPGAQLPFRRWGTANFAEVCRYIRVNYQLEILILGSKSDRDLAEEIMKLSGSGLIDFTGRTNLKQLPGLISKASLLITNDTMAVHFGAAVEVPTLVISQLNHYGRFVPYPRGIHDKMFCIVPKEFQSQDEYSLAERFQSGSEVDINLITIEQVTSAADLILKNPAAKPRT